MTFRVDQVSLNIQCQEDCEIEAEYAVSSQQSKNVVLAFVLPTIVTVQVSVNDTSVPASTASVLNQGDHRLQQNAPFMRMESLLHEPEPRLFYAAFKAPLSSGSNTILIRYTQPYNHDVVSYKNAAGHWEAIRQLRYEFWPLRDWYLSDTFTMTVHAEFSVAAPEEDELMVQYYDWPRPSPSDSEHLISSSKIIIFHKEWKHSFPGRAVWFVGDKKMLEVSNGFIEAR